MRMMAAVCLSLALALGRMTGEGILVSAGSMGSPRAAHTATTLPDGRVLLAGGMKDGENTVAGAELFDPATGTFVPAGPMRTHRHSHAATALADGRVLLAGGYDAEGRYLRSAELYDPASNRFAAAGAMSTARAGQAAIPLRNGRILFAGGVGDGWTFLASAELYDPATGTFAATGSMRVPRESHAAVLLDDGRVLVVGGHRGRRSDIELYASAEMYDPATGIFSRAGDMTIRRHKHDAVLLGDGRVLITGGTDERDSRGIYRSAEIYDPRTGAFRPAASMRLPRYKHRGTSVRLADGRVLVAGGATAAEIYDPSADAFSLVPGADELPGQFSAIAALAQGSALVTGGYGDRRGPQSGAWIYRAEE